MRAWLRSRVPTPPARLLKGKGFFTTNRFNRGQALIAVSTAWPHVRQSQPIDNPFHSIGSLTTSYLELSCWLSFISYHGHTAVAIVGIASRGGRSARKALPGAPCDRGST